MKIVIIGNGIGGVTVAQEASADPALSITLLAGEERPFYSRVRLPEVVAGNFLGDGILIGTIPCGSKANPGKVRMFGGKDIDSDTLDRLVNWE